ncbi:aldehyde dehydrogenase family protein [Pantoea ananatis]|uniref:aldehyde dehydrogenase family protein n=1 Tax=Pantoea ananas TaxID=553 RepID=UPI0039B8D062
MSAGRVLVQRWPWVGRAMALGEQLRTGLLHINDQTVNDEVVNPFGGVGASGNGSSIGGPANLEGSPSGSG